MPSLQFTDQQCFFAVMVVFVALGLQRGWRREMVSLVFVLLAVILVRPESVKNLGAFFGHGLSMLGSVVTGASQKASAGTDNQFPGPWGSVVLFVGLIVLGYFVGNKAFAKPATPAERFIGVVPAVASGAFVLSYVSSMVPKNAAGQAVYTVPVVLPDPVNYMPVLLLIVIVAVLIALVMSRSKRPVKK